MRLLSLTLLLFFGTVYGACAQTTVEVKLTGVKPGQGNLRVGLFNEGNYLKTPVEGKIAKATAESVVIVFENVPAGTYALSVIHDANENGDLDKTKLGIPKEGFAFSNNVMGKKGPPSYDKAKFEVRSSTVKQELKMRYP
ncbi:DUF2141 domain-containing protein [Chryseolinea sp. T2]|uniref:DUF2141 domain-containing protein n=1 Tax=Chryseolinea sp. T2 TaxID=3129255 RepID=UPI0030783218